MLYLREVYSYQTDYRAWTPTHGKHQPARSLVQISYLYPSFQRNTFNLCRVPVFFVPSSRVHAVANAHILRVQLFLGRCVHLPRAVGRACQP